jgi:hypothetical protein
VLGIDKVEGVDAEAIGAINTARGVSNVTAKAKLYASW